MLSAFLVGMIVGALVFWRVSRWWRKSSFKKATDTVGTVAQGPSQVAKGVYRKAKDLYDKKFKPKKQRDDKEDQ